MNIRVKMKDGSVETFRNVQYHPAFSRRYPFEIAEPDGLWMRLSDVRKHNETHGNRSLEQLFTQIDFAEAPFEILDCEEPEPWRHCGVLGRSVGYGGGEAFWASR